MGVATARMDTGTGHVLVVDDDARVRFAVCGALRRRGYLVTEADSCESAALAALSGRPDVVVTDLRLPDGNALDLLARMKAANPAVAIFIVTGFGTIDLAVRAVKQGAENMLTKPVDLDALTSMVGRALDRKKSSSGVRNAPPPFVSYSDAMRRIDDQVERLRDADCSVLILGETGTGKSLLARRIHAIGARGREPFVDVSCPGLSKDFVETELFGHEKGAFTGAHATKQGLLDAANGGTVFLDEIGDIDLVVQPKLLKVLEEKRFRRMGDVKERSVDVRLLAATHHDLLRAIEEKTFRADLYYRISTVTITMPSLRDRAEDILPLTAHLLADLGAGRVELAPDAKEALTEHAWPGNLRELKNVLERALIHRSGDLLRARDLRFDRPSEARIPAAKRLAMDPATGTHSRTLSDVERAHIQSVLDEEHGRVEAAARRLGIPRSTLYQRLKDYGIRLTRRARSDPPASR